MPEPSLPDKVVELHRALRRRRVTHAFGGAIALAYYAEPRATVDIDVNIFLPPTRYERVLAVLEPFGITRVPAPSVVERDGQARVWWGRNPIDLFFAKEDIHDAMRRATRTVPFGEVEIPVLSPEHLMVAKVVFDRAKDWIDIEQMLIAVPALDVEEVHRWMARFVADDDGRWSRFDDAVARTLGGQAAGDLMH